LELNDLSKLTSVSNAITKILSDFKSVGTEIISVRQSNGRVLAKDFYAWIESPIFDNSAMDGFAIQAEDTLNASEAEPICLRVIADIPTGINPSANIRSGEAARVVTGAVIPTGADAVVPVEDTNIRQWKPGSKPTTKIFISKKLVKGQHIRPKGQYIKKAEKLIQVGKRLRPQHVGLLASQGVREIEVFRKPRIALFSTGDELLSAGEPLEPGKIYDTNSYTLETLIHENHCEAHRFKTSADTEEDVRSVLKEVINEGTDLIITSGGVSMGAFDFIRSVIEKDGEVKLWRVNMRPGKPLLFGTYKEVPIVGLPGNPVSAFIGFEVFIKPALNKLSGNRPSRRLAVKVRMIEDVKSDGRESYLRAHVFYKDGEWKGSLKGHQGSGNIFSLVQANALVIIPTGIKRLPANSFVDAWMLDRQL
jgi:molybdopterin molybdotransferase